MSKRICVPCWRFDCLACEGQGCPCNHWTLEDGDESH